MSVIRKYTVLNPRLVIVPFLSSAFSVALPPPKSPELRLVLPPFCVGAPAAGCMPPPRLENRLESRPLVLSSLLAATAYTTSPSEKPEVIST